MTEVSNRIDKYTAMAFRQKQDWSYSRKITHAQEVAESFVADCEEKGLNYHISVGGLDSITLLLFLRSIGIDCPAVSVSSLEDISIQRIHKALGIERIRPLKTKTQVINELGFPVISKAKAKKIEYLQTPNSEKQTFIHAIMTGDMGEQGHWEHSEKIKLPDKYVKLFGGLYSAHRPDIPYCGVAPFKVSSDCCYWMKELPADMWAKEHNSKPFLGLMASEGGQRELGLVKNGCNYWGKNGYARSAPFAIFQRQDILMLALEMESWYQEHWEEFRPISKLPDGSVRYGEPIHLSTIVPEIYGTIESRNPRWDGDIGELYTTEAQRTGCQMCGFGIHIEKRPHRFDRLRQRNFKEWEFWMYRCATDPDTGEKFGWGRVLDYLGIPWEDEYVDIDSLQMKFLNRRDSEMNYKEILKSFAQTLDSEIKQQTDPFQITFIMGNTLKGNFANEDLVELRGYYKGLKVAREILQRCLLLLCDGDECSPDCEFSSICYSDEKEE